ncbi:YbaB/EbfC family nucleoid-associated protein [Micromonospora sp. NPDC005710]|uniref:YbaB/EbfC family nucleoid-associated protein n=1 Tax=Micromonospora sp. NPDC005710 TaxID=3157051 RepID=UPI0033E7CFF9
MSVSRDASGDFARMLDATVGALRAVSPPPEGEEAARQRRSGEAADGQVRAEFGADGRLSSLAVDPRLMRQGSGELSDLIVEAVNAAIDSMRGGASAPGAADLTQLTEQLQEVRDAAVPRLSTFLQTLTEAQARMSGGSADR